MTGYQIPFTGLNRQYDKLRPEILDATDAVLSTGRLMDGDFTARFESWLAEKNRTRYAITCHSGTQALECLAQFYATEPGVDLEPVVGIPALTYTATANAFVRAGWRVQFIDVDDHGIVDFESVTNAREITALVLVGLYGASVKNALSGLLATKILLNDITIIEDAAQHWLADRCHRLGHAAAISFDPMKNLGANGNGGAVVTNDEILYDYVKSMCNNGKPHHDMTGTNSRMSELECAHMLVKARYIDQWQQRRRDIARYYCDRLADLPVRCLIGPHNSEGHCFHKFVIDSDRRNELRQYLDEQGTETRVHYERALHELPLFWDCPSPGIICKASALSRQVLSLPIYPELTDGEIEQVMDQVAAFFS